MNTLRLSSMRKQRLKHKLNNEENTSQTIDVIQLFSKQKTYNRKKPPSFFLPQIEQSSALSNEDFIMLRNSIVQTVRKLQDKLFIPHNASKKRNLQLIRKRKGSDQKAVSNKETRSFSLQQNQKNKGIQIRNDKIKRQISLDEKMSTSSTTHRNEIASCSLQDTIFYG